MKPIITFLFCLIASHTFSQSIFINEFDADMPGTDNKEFIEIKSTTPFASLNGFIVVFFNETDQKSYYSIDLSGLTTDANGIALIGNVSVDPTPDRITSANVIQNGPDVVAIYQSSVANWSIGTLATTNNLVQALAYSNANGTAVLPANLSAIFGLTIAYNDYQPSGAISKSIQRKSDGTYEVKVPTPGLNNDGTGILFNYINVPKIITEYKEGESLSFVLTTSNQVSGSDLNFSITLNKGSFTSGDYSGNLNLTIPVGSNQVTANINIIDDNLYEDDEEAKLFVFNTGTNYKVNNNSQIIRIHDTDFEVKPYGAPNNPTFGKVASTAPSNYYSSLIGLSGNALKQELQNIIANPITVRAHNYGDVWEILQKADQNPANSSQVWLLYSEVPRSKLDQQSGSDGTGKWNREHIFPQSRGKFKDGTSSTPDGISVWLPTSANDILSGHSDAHHLRAEDNNENSVRNNRDFGLDYNGPIGTLGKWKGDVARSLFYMGVRYNGLTLINGDPNEDSNPASAEGNIGDLASLLQWNDLDPADDFEMNRNNYVYTWQNNRNPFIDYPDLANYIFGNKFGMTWNPLLQNANFETNKLARIYPNPTTNYFFIDGNENTYQIIIKDSIGKLILSQLSYNQTSLNFILPSGIYFVEIQGENSKQIEKIIVK